MEEEKNETETITEDNVNENITREINLDELYDGAVNNTVIIDPVTKNEVLLKSRHGGGRFMAVIILILLLLLLYFITNKLDINNKKADVKPNVTSTTSVTIEPVKKGVITCSYTSESSSEKQSATYKVNYENSVIIDSEFNYVVNLLSESSEIYTDLEKQYENFFINNATFTGISFTKEDKSFNFKAIIKYEGTDFSKLTGAEGQTILYAIPSSDDTVESINEVYTNKGYTCSNSVTSGE